MALQSPHFWDTAGDLVQIILCLFILFFFIRNRRYQKKHTAAQTVKQLGKSFNQQVFTQAVQQQIDQIFSNIIENLAVERGNLERMLRLNHQDGDGSIILNKKSIFRTRHDPGSQRISDKTAAGDQRHEKIRKFSARGLSARKISDELKIPLNEVELILSLQKK